MLSYAPRRPIAVSAIPELNACTGRVGNATAWSAPASCIDWGARRRFMARKTARLLGRIGAARIYRAALDVSPHLRYLNLPALKRARRVEIPIGSVTIPSRTIPIVVVSRSGEISELRAADSSGSNTRSRSRRRPARKRMALARATHEKLRALGLHSTPMPMPVAMLTQRRFLPSIDIVITPDGVICIRIESSDGRRGCLICSDGTTCWRPSVPPIG